MSVELMSDNLRRGLFRDRIYIETNTARLRTYGYMLNADVQTFFSVIPEMLHRRDAVEPGTQEVTSAVVSAEQPITIEGLVSCDPAIVVNVKQNDSPNTAILAVGIAPGAAPGVKNSTLEFSVVGADGQQSSHSLRAIIAVKQPV